MDLAFEVDAMRRFRGSKRVISLVELFETEHSVYIVMPYFAGGSISASRTTYNETQIQAILKGILQGLVEMHAAGYIHRDIKPENILLPHGGILGEVVLADLGMG